MVILVNDVLKQGLCVQILSRISSPAEVFLLLKMTHGVSMDNHQNVVYSEMIHCHKIFLTLYGSS
jgi:hypothetical protein